LGLAFAKFSQQKKEEVEKNAATNPLYAKDKDEALLQSLLDSNSGLAKKYKEIYEDIKNDKEADEIEANRLYDKYSYIVENDRKRFTKYSEEYDLTQKKETPEEEIFTTDLSDAESDLIYKRYKAWKDDIKEDAEEIQEKMESLTQTFRLKKGMLDGKRVRNFDQYKNEMYKLANRKEKKQELNTKLEELIATLRIAHDLSKFNLTDVLNQYDPNFPDEIPEF